MDNERKIPKWSKTFIKHFLILIVIAATVFGVWFYMAYDKDFSDNVEQRFNKVDDYVSNTYETAVAYNDFCDANDSELIGALNGTGDTVSVEIETDDDSDGTTYTVESGSDDTSIVKQEYLIGEDGDRSVANDKNAFNRFTGRLNFYNSIQVTDEYMGVYDKDLNMITDTRKPIVLSVKLQGLNDQYYNYMYTSDNKELYDALNSIKDSEYIDEDYKPGKVYKDVVLDSIYVKGNVFEPASGRLVEFKKAKDGEEKEVSSKELTFSKDPLKEGYKLADLKGDAIKSVIGPLSTGHHSDVESKYFKELEDIVKKEYPYKSDIYEAADEGPEVNMIQGVLSDNVYYNFYVINPNVTRDTGATYSDYFIVANVFKYSFFREDSGNTKRFAIACAITFALALIISIITSSISHSKKKTAYETESYRDSVIESIAHDLKSPLTIIRGYAENLADAKDSDNEYVGGIIDKVDDMNEVIDKSILMSKSKDIKAQLNITEVNVRSLVEDIIDERTDMLSSHDMTVTVDGDCTLSTDYMWFKRVLINLVENAVNHGDSGEIAIKLDASKIAIINPFSKELDIDVTELKKPFAKGSKERGTHGTGLGLAVTDNILTQLNYKLDIAVDEGKFIATIHMVP